MRKITVETGATASEFCDDRYGVVPGAGYEPQQVAAWRAYRAAKARTAQPGDVEETLAVRPSFDSAASNQQPNTGPAL